VTKEPSNKQLANFLVVYAKQIPGFQDVQLNPVMIDIQLKVPEFRKVALRHYQKFQQQITELHELMEAGDLQCDHIRTNGKKCPNRNTPGSYYCGLHQDEEMV
jgi:hypothetical protein